MRRFRRCTIVALLGAITFTTPAFAMPSDSVGTLAGSHHAVAAPTPYLGGADIIDPSTLIEHRHLGGADIITPQAPNSRPAPPTWPTHYTPVHSTQPATTEGDGDSLPSLPIGIGAVLVAAAAMAAGARVVSHRRHARLGA
jgi:hypothetical protein